MAENWRYVTISLSE